MKRFFCILTVCLIALCLSSCGEIWHEDEESYFKIAFPEDMKVFKMSEFTADNPDIEAYDLDVEQLESFRDNEGGKYFAKSVDGRQCSVSIIGSETTINIWELKKSDGDMVTEVYKQLAKDFNSRGYSILGKTEVEQGGGHYIYMEMSSSGDEVLDTLYMTTVKNGLQYQIIYYAPEITSEIENSAHKIFDNAIITKTIRENTGEGNSKSAKLMLLGVGAAIIIVVVMMAASLSRRKRKEAEKEEYVPQFKDDLK